MIALGLAGFAGAVVGIAQARVDALPTFELTNAQRFHRDMGMTRENDPAKQARARACLARTLAKYPPASLAGRLDAIYVVRQLWSSQAFYGGTPSEDRRRIYLAVGTAARIDETWMEHALHHEIAHIFQFKNASAFPIEAWRRANAKEFRYAAEDEASGGAALATGKTRRAFDPALNAKGILCEYGAATPAEDWACIAEEILADNPAFWKLTEKYPRLRVKARLALDFYHKAMPGIRLRLMPEPR